MSEERVEYKADSPQQVLRRDLRLLEALDFGCRLLKARGLDELANELYESRHKKGLSWAVCQCIAAAGREGVSLDTVARIEQMAGIPPRQVGPGKAAGIGPDWAEVEKLKEELRRVRDDNLNMELTRADNESMKSFVRELEQYIEKLKEEIEELKQPQDIPAPRLVVGGVNIDEQRILRLMNEGEWDEALKEFRKMHHMVNRWVCGNCGIHSEQVGTYDGKFTCPACGSTEVTVKVAIKERLPEVGLDPESMAFEHG